MPKELTLLEQDAATYGRYYFVAVPAAYTQMAGYVNATRGWPTPEPMRVRVLKGLPDPDRLDTTNDETGRLMLSLETRRLSVADFETMAPFIDAGAIQQLTKAEFDALKPSLP